MPSVRLTMLSTTFVPLVSVMSLFASIEPIVHEIQLDPHSPKGGARGIALVEGTKAIDAKIEKTKHPPGVG